MKISDHVESCFEDAKAGRFDAALLHACIGIDATSKLLYPSQKSVGKRFVQCIRDYYWLVEPMLGARINLDLTRFENVRLTKTRSPDFADIAYEIFRCGHTHGDEIPDGFKVLPSHGKWHSQWLIGKNTLRLPDRIVWALLSISIFAKVNERQKVQKIGPFNITLGDHCFPVMEWWGQEDRIRPIALEHNQVRVDLQELGRMWDAPDNSKTSRLQIVQPNVPERIRLEFSLPQGATAISTSAFTEPAGE